MLEGGAIEKIASTILNACIGIYVQPKPHILVFPDASFAMSMIAEKSVRITTPFIVTYSTSRLMYALIVLTKRNVIKFMLITQLIQLMPNTLDA